MQIAMSVDDARQRVLGVIHDILTDLAVEDELDDTDREETAEMMAGVAEMILDALRFTIVSVDNDIVTAQLRLGSPAI